MVPAIAPDYTRGQRDFMYAIEVGRSVFLTGKAGTGKSYIVKEAQAYLDDRGIKYISIAPTGIAAQNINGQTIHSMFRLDPYPVLTSELCKHMKDSARQVLKHARVIFIDEVSMLRPDILDAMHWTLRKNGLPGLDKKIIIFVGDLKQLPPPIDDNFRSKLLEIYNGDTFEYSKIYRSLDVQTIELDEVKRQSDIEFLEALNFLRDGGRNNPYFRQFIHTEPKGIILAPHKSTVLEYNLAGLNAQAGELFTFEADIRGNAKPEDFSLEKTVQVKNGCKIMYLANSQSNDLKNGTLGIFVSHEGCHFIRVGNVDYALERVEVTKKQYVYNAGSDKLELEELGKIEQYPIKLAYALTIHKAQGLTFDEITVDLRQPAFQKGQIYVAFSRVRTPQGLRIIVK